MQNMELTTAHAGTLEVIRRITDDGILAEREVWDLAEYLNDNEEARMAWPGSDLFPILHEVFEDGVLDNHEMEGLAKILSQIEHHCADGEVVPETATAEYDSVSLAAIRIEEFELPKVEKMAKIPCKPSGETYRVNLRTHTCDCPAWKGNRKDFPLGDMKRACVHIVDAYQETVKADGGTPLPGIFGHLIADLSTRGRGIDPKSDWKLLKVQTLPHLVSIGPEWCSVYARKHGEGFDRYAYNLSEQRWAYGDSPKNRLYLEKYLNTSAGERPVGGLASQPG
jgi:hypothetical protein